MPRKGSSTKTFWNYIMASNTGALYNGVTSAITRRVLPHKRKAIPGFSAKYGCTRLVWYECWGAMLLRRSRGKTDQGLVAEEEDRFDRSDESSMGGSGEDVGRGDGVSARIIERSDRVGLIVEEAEAA